MAKDYLVILYVNNYIFQANNESYSYSYQFLEASDFHREKYMYQVWQMAV